MKRKTLRALTLFGLPLTLAAMTLLSACGDDSSPSTKPATLAFVSPPAGATAEIGTSFAITLDVTHPDNIANGIYIVGRDGFATTKIALKAPFSTTVSVPADLPLGDYTLTAIARTAHSEKPITASTVVTIVPNPSMQRNFEPLQETLVFEAIGERLPITVPFVARFVTYTSRAPSIATVTDAGIVMAQASGQTAIDIALLGTTFDSVKVRVLEPAIEPSNTQIKFNSQQTDSTSAAKTVTLTNQAKYPVKILGVNTGSIFPTSGNCLSSSPLASGERCTISVSFSPAATGKVQGVLRITNSAVIAPTRILLTGTGT